MSCAKARLAGDSPLPVLCLQYVLFCLFDLKTSFYMCGGRLNFETAPNVSAPALALRSTKKALFSILSGGGFTQWRHISLPLPTRRSEEPPGGHFVGPQLVKTPDVIVSDG